MATKVSLPVLEQTVEVGIPENDNDKVVDVGQPLRYMKVNVGQISHNRGNCYTYTVSLSFFGTEDKITPGDLSGGIMENQLILGPARVQHADIAATGRGCYSCWYDSNGKTVTFYFSTSDNSDPRTNGRTYTIFNQIPRRNFESRQMELESIYLNPDLMGHYEDNCFTYKIPRSFYNQEDLAYGDIPGTILEDNKILGPIYSHHGMITRFGRGRVSVWHDPAIGDISLFFSSSDNTDPRTNGRTYTFINRHLEHANDWERLYFRNWLNHSKGRYFLRRGGDKIPPPLFANMGITDICNLKCGICGSQNMPHPVNRRHMDYRIFSMVADTLFPILTTVEFNSRGEPLLHPQMPEMLETIYDYGIFLRLQTNGTQFQARRLTNLAKLTGEVSISIDATGDLFEYARTNGKWPQVDEGVRNLIKLRNRDRLGVNIYPTLTGKTIAGAEELIVWSMDAGVDKIDFHLYDPIYGGNEQIPTAQQVDALKLFAAKLDNQHPIEICVNYERVKEGITALLPQPPQMKYPNIPRVKHEFDGNPEYTCMAPVQMVDIDLDGGVCVCCMLQERKLGNALTVEAFADCWFGAEYQAVRNGLKRSSKSALYESCRLCVARYAPGESACGGATAANAAAKGLLPLI